MRQPILVIIGGLPAAGKTTVARRVARDLRAAYVRVDTIETAITRAEGRYATTNQWEAPPGYAVGFEVAADQLRAGLDVVAESVNPLQLSRDGWRESGQQAEAHIVEVEIICSDADEHRRRLEERELDIPHLQNPTWADVLNRKYERWDRDRIIVDTATLDPDQAARLIREEMSNGTGSR